MVSFSKVVKKIMDEKRLGVREISRIAGMDASFLSKVLSGKRNPPSEEKVIKRLARALGIDYVYLMFLAGRIPSEFQEIFLSEKFIMSLYNTLNSTASADKIPAPRRYVSSSDISPSAHGKQNYSTPDDFQRSRTQASAKDIAHPFAEDKQTEQLESSKLADDEISEDLL